MRNLRWTINGFVSTTVKLLLIESNQNYAEKFESIIRKKNWQNIRYYKTTTLKHAKEIISSEGIDIIFLDFDLSDNDNKASYYEFIKFSNDIPVVILCESEDEKLANELVSNGAQDYLVKNNFSEFLLTKTINFTIRKNALLKEKKNLADSLLTLVNNINLTVFVVNFENRIVFVDNSVEHLTGKQPAELIGNRFPLNYSPNKTMYSSLSVWDKENSFVEIKTFDTTWENKEATIITLRDITEFKLKDEQLHKKDRIKIALNEVNQLILRTESIEDCVIGSLEILIKTKCFKKLQLFVYNQSRNKYYLFVKKLGEKITKFEVSSNHIQNIYNIDGNKNKLYAIPPSPKSNNYTYIKALKSKNDFNGYLLADSFNEESFKSDEKELFVKIADELGYAIYILNLKTELNEQIKRVEKTEQLFNDFFNESLTGNFISTADGKLVDCNDTYLEIFGFSSRQEALSYDLTKLYPDSHTRDSLIKLLQIQNFLKGYEIEMRKTNGELIFVEANMRAEYDEYGKVKHIIGVVNDITEKKRAINGLIESENKFRKLSDNFPAAVAIIKNNKLQYTNKFAAVLTGYSIEELYSIKYLDLLNKYDAKRILQLFNSESISTEPVRDFELEITSKHGFKKWIDITAIQIEYGKGKAILISALDVTERKRAESEIRKLSQAVHQSPIGVIITDKNGNIEYVNNYFTKITGFKAIDVLGENPSLLQSGLTKNSVYKEMWEALSAGETWSGEFINKGKNGENFIIKSTISPIKNSRGEITHYVALEEDITELKNMISELVEAREAAEKADSLKSEFIAQISHEIRTPLNPIMSYTSYLREEFKDVIDDNLNFIFDSIERSGKRLIRTVELLIYNSDLQVGSYRKFIKRLDVRAHVLEPCYNEYYQLAINKGLEFVIDAPFGLTIDGDEMGMIQILLNLVDNSIKYTDKGSVKLSAKRKDDKVIIKVSDTGIGIGSEFLPKLFNPFSQEDSGYTRRFDGTGLGMSLVNKFCELNNIDIDVISEKGKGTEITLTMDFSGDQHKE